MIDLPAVVIAAGRRKMVHRFACLVIVMTLAAGCSTSGGSSQSSEATPPGSDVTDASRQADFDEAEPSAPQEPRFREVTLPAGTAFATKLVTVVASDASRAEDPVRATLTEPVVVDGTTVVPAGAELSGVVLEANQSGRVKGVASVAFRFNRLHVGSETHDISTARIARRAETTKGEDAAKIGIGAGVGAAVGAIAGGGKGAGVGAAVGAGTGTGVVLATRGDEVRFPAGSAVRATLSEPVTIAVPVS
jgi:hypothetical protein